MRDRLRVTPVAQLCQIPAAMASKALGDAGEHPGWGSGAVVFEVELSFEGLVDRFDPLTGGGSRAGRRKCRS